jgi:dolichyl-phosphate-mannose-protein mannosyltransferase
VHFGGFASDYLRREYFFDVHPPLGKLVYALVGCIFGYEGNFSFANIGLEYSADVPYLAMRIVSAIFGAMLAPTCFIILKEMKLLTTSSVFGSALILLDNALITQTRFILLDSFLILPIFLSSLCWVKFRQSASLTKM